MTAYNETCAAVGNDFWNYRLFLLHADAKYVDVMERTLYNGLISGVSLDGKAFFYPNPLESIGQHERSQNRSVNGLLCPSASSGANTMTSTAISRNDSPTGAPTSLNVDRVFVVE